MDYFSHSMYSKYFIFERKEEGGRGRKKGGREREEKNKRERRKEREKKKRERKKKKRGREEGKGKKHGLVVMILFELKNYVSTAGGTGYPAPP